MKKWPFCHRKPLFFWKHWNFHQKLPPNVTKKSRAVNIAQWNIDFQYQYQYIEDIDASIDIEFRFLRILILILILRLEKILVLILILILIVFQGQYWYWSWYWKWNFRKYWYWYWTKISYCPTSASHGNRNDAYNYRPVNFVNNLLCTASNLNFNRWCKWNKILLGNLFVFPMATIHLQNL